MKSVLALITLLTLSTSVFAFQDGSYTCGTKADKIQFSYTIKTLNLNGTAVAFLDVTKSFNKDASTPDTQDKTYHIKGIATQFTDESGKEVLVLGNITLDLTAGRPTCGL